MTDPNPGNVPPRGYRGQKYEIQYVDRTGIWKTFAWQNEQFGGMLPSVAAWPEARRYRIVEVDPAIQAIFYGIKR